jgi:hypothetical protein
MTPTFHHAGLPWIKHIPGDPMPCPSDTLVLVLLREDLAVSRHHGCASKAGGWSWDDFGGRGGEIIGWHPIEETLRPTDLISGDTANAPLWPRNNHVETHRRAVEWNGLTDAGLRLRLGELTAQEIRTLRAVLNAIVGE